MTYDPPYWADKRSYDEGFDDGGDSVVRRVRAAYEIRCLRVVAGTTMQTCGLNKGHIGGCATINATITVSRERLEEILDG